MQSFLALKDLTKRYGSFTAIDNVSMSVDQGEFLTLLGPSGSGKTTILMTIAGFVTPDSGDILVNGKVITPLPPEKRNFGMVLQGYALFPHLSVFDNVAFSLNVRRRPKDEISATVRQALDMVQLAHLADRMPKQLSGGQQQRVAIARALAFKPDVLLLDEPMSALDKKLRAEVQQELRDLHKRLGMTFICVTHDQDEALSLSDRVAILRDGRIEQVGSPKQLYEQPRSRFVADFLGRSNFIEGRVQHIDAGGFTYSCGNSMFTQSLDGIAPPAANESVLVALRPEKVSIGAQPFRPGVNCVEGKIVAVSYAGIHDHVTVRTVLGIDLSVTVPARKAEFSPEEGATVWLGWGADESIRVVNG